MTDPSPTTTMRCPACGVESVETMPIEACVYFWTCPTCGVVVKPKLGHCCVFCPYADAPCPPKQRG